MNGGSGRGGSVVQEVFGVRDYEDFEEVYEDGQDDGYEEAMAARRRRTRRGSWAGYRRNPGQNRRRRGACPRNTRNSSGCYVATSVYGSYDCPQVWVLRRFRDRFLKRYALGRGFIRLYYRFSPGLVARCGGYRFFSAVVRRLLDRLTVFLRKRGYSDAPYQDR